VPKPAAKSSQKPLVALTRDLPPGTLELFSELRSLILGTIPEAAEKANLGWKSLNFSHPGVGYFCGLFPVDDRVIVAFEFGVLLPDPDGILDRNSCAKQVRYLRIRSGSAIPRSGLKRLLRTAVALPEKRSTRLALVRAGAQPVDPQPNGRPRTPS